MIYLVSRSIAQGRAAGLLSLGGSATGFAVYMVGASCGISALLTTVPLAHGSLRFVGAAYLMFLTWQAFKSGGRSLFKLASARRAGRARTFAMGFLTTMLNPKPALLYLALLPQFVTRGCGDILSRTVVLGMMHIALNVTVGVAIACTADAVASGLSKRPSWLRARRRLTDGLFAGFSVRLAADV